jgi:hypothetical protein
MTTALSKRQISALIKKGQSIHYVELANENVPLFYSKPDINLREEKNFYQRKSEIKD